jgi:hypothetical protein
LARFCSSGRSQTLGDEGKSGKIQPADTAITMVKVPSTKKSHLQQKNQNSFTSQKYVHFRSDLQAVKPNVPSRLPKIPDAKRAPKALLIEAPQERSAVRNPSSLGLYLEEFQYVLFRVIGNHTIVKEETQLQERMPPPQIR